MSKQEAHEKCSFALCRDGGGCLLEGYAEMAVRRLEAHKDPLR